MKYVLLILLLPFLSASSQSPAAISGLMERISPGLSEKINVEILNDPARPYDWYAVVQDGDRPKITASSPVSAAVGLNTYLKKCARVHLSWNSMTASLPDTLPGVADSLAGECLMPMRYYLNYCTHSYSMAFWDKKRWQQEIDWMALHGINMPLAITGSAALWRNVLRRLNYSDSDIDRFIAGPGFQAWWLMNNLEGWGGPNTDHFYKRDCELQQFIVGRMREYGMEPVLPGYSGMIPSSPTPIPDTKVTNPGRWCGFTRPSFIAPGQPAFDSIASIYYDELHKLYGRSRFYSMDPFHEGGNSEGVDLGKAGMQIAEAMTRANPDAVWVAQGWQENPRAAMVDSLPFDRMVILDLQAENHPMWKQRPATFSRHPWLYCMLLNYGGNVGMYGKLEPTIAGYAEALVQSPTLSGTGLTMEGIENNPVMYDLLCDLPWLSPTPSPDEWLEDYVTARYGTDNPNLKKAWRLLARSVYACPPEVVQQGTIESLFCARPSDNPLTVSAWANSQQYYDQADILEAARLFLAVPDSLTDGSNYRYDLVDIVRQAVADRGRILSGQIADAATRNDSIDYRRLSEQFLDLILLQDSLLASDEHFRLGRWTEMARDCGNTPEESDRMEWNARTQITVWGTRESADAGRLHDYAHREWQGLLRDFYYPRWKKWFDARLASWNSDKSPRIDFYEMERTWADEPLTGHAKRYSSTPEGDPVAISRAAVSRLSRMH